jgi:hypothetical protein
MGVFKYVPGVIRAIIPSVAADPMHQLQWRWAVAMLLLLTTMTQLMHILIACGWLSWLGVPGFAYASDVADLSIAQRRTEIRQVEKYLMDMEATNCRALSQGKPTRYIVEQIRANAQEYKSLSGQTWQRPTCLELGE